MNLNIPLLVLCLLFMCTTNAQQEEFSCDVPDTQSPHFLAGNCSNYDVTTEEILRYPIMTYKIVFHYVNKTGGPIWTFDESVLNDPSYPNDLFVGQWQTYMIDRLNALMTDPIIIGSQYGDSRIRFEYANGPDWEDSAFLYDNANAIIRQPDAINIQLISPTNSTSTSGSTPGYGFNRLTNNNDLNKIRAGNSKLDRSASSILHEFLHSRNLRHTFHCENPCNGFGFDVYEQCGGRCALSDGPGESAGCFGQGPRLTELVMGYNGAQKEITECEAQQLWNYILANDRPYQSFDLCEDWLEQPPLELNEIGTITWNGGKHFINSDLIIKSGTTLKVECTIEMGPSTTIVLEKDAKLIVDGGIITSACEAKYWEGIEVVGNPNDDNNNADIVLTNGAIIEKVNGTAISMKPPLPWPEMSNYANGVIHADNATFRNVFRGVELISFSSTTNNSMFEDCTFSDSEYGITNWNGLGVTVENCDFIEINRHALTTDGGMLLIDNCNVNAYGVGILFGDVTATQASSVKNSTINSPSVGIQTYGATFRAQNFEGNVFEGSGIGVYAEGDNHYNIHSNTFRSDLGVRTVANGTGTNNIYNNSFDGSNQGMQFEFDNESLNFFGNCFSTFSIDVSINGSVYEHISAGYNYTNRNFIAAGNCFSHGGFSESNIIDVTGNHNPINYYVEDLNGFDDCFDLKNPSSILLPTEAEGNSLACVAGFTGNTGVVNDFCNPEPTPQAAWASYQYINGSISSVINDHSYSTLEREAELSDLYRCRKKVIRLLVEIDVNNGNWIASRAKANLDISEDGWILKYSTYIKQHELDSAEAYLDATGPGSLNWQAYKTAQYINIADLRNGPIELAKSASGTLSDERRKTIKTVYKLAKNDKNPYAGYIKALYYRLTGILLHSDIAEVEGGSGPDSIRSSIPSVNVFPNPTTNRIKVLSSTPLTMDGYLVDMNGRVVLNFIHKGHGGLISLDNITKGVYILRLTNGSTYNFQRKIVIQ